MLLSHIGTMFFYVLSSAGFFNLSGILSECQTASIQIRTDVLSVLNWVQTICKGYQQTTKVTASKVRVNGDVSDLCSDQSGVAMGSVLSPCVF